MLKIIQQRIVLFLSTQFLLTTAFVVVPHQQQGGFNKLSSSSSSSQSRLQSHADEAASSHNGKSRRHLAEFLNLEPLPESNARRERLEREEQNKVDFATYGNELWKLRSNIQDLSHELVDAIHKGENDRGIRSMLRNVEKQDPELVYRMELEAMHDAEEEEDIADEIHHKEKALNARSCLPHFNLEGLWVGKYGSHGYEMINVTYAGDTLIAYKVTGDKNVPRGEVTFQADLNPLVPANNHVNENKKNSQDDEQLNPIMLTDKAATKWGTSQLPRYHGLGRVAEEDFQNSQWMEGQLIIIGEEYFSFAWVPIEHQIFFGRPSPELALKMLRDGGISSLKTQSWDVPPSQDDDFAVWKDYATHCFERTEETLEEDLFGDEFGCIWHGIDTEECCFE